jgi:SAM-dependent methyltransferase
MDETTWQTRRLSFGDVADVYDRSRPDYPAAAVGWLAGDIPRRVLDLGAGTGKLTRMLVDAGHEVVAVEPSAGMRSALRAGVPGAEVLDGAAEDIPLRGGSVDVVVAAQAYHWFDRVRALPEIARVLRPGGVLGLIWNQRDDGEPWVAALWALLGEHPSERHGEGAPALAPPFGPVEAATFPHRQALDLGGLLDLVRSRSYVATLADAERTGLLERITELTRTHPDLAGRRQFGLPYVTEAYRAVRLPSG